MWSTPMDVKRIYALALNPWMVVGSLSAGVAFGMLAPQAAIGLGIVGDIYIDLLKMVTLPFMVSAVIFSLQKLFRDGGASSSFLGRIVVVFMGFSIFVAIAGAITLLVMRPGENLSASTMQTFGQIVGGDLSASDTSMNLRGVDIVQKTVSFADVLVSLVPTNIFSALANGDTLKTLVFALLFGMAIGHVPSRISDGLTQALETIYHACQKLMHWLSFPLPIVLFCMSAAQNRHRTVAGHGPVRIGNVRCVDHFAGDFRFHHMEAVFWHPQPDVACAERAICVGTGHAQQRGMHAHHD